MANELKSEKSPYLKQHKDNPVEWLAWNKNSLLKAKEQKKPIFLSVGYASCHWCHVMAHESFENFETAKIMNEKFINIKVDREERPDLDFIFQKSLAILTGAQGGWPLSMFLDENGVPFTGGTYFPPTELQGRPSFSSVLENVSKVYSENREKIIQQKSQMEIVFKELNKKNAVLKQNLEPFVERILQYLDEKNGGFKGAPKFPQFYMFETIFHFFNKNKKENFILPVKRLLESISKRGIYDHLEGGISRYTVDEKWIIPHFEKMLYDNIQFVILLSSYINYKEEVIFKQKLKQTIKFINKEFNAENNLLGSAFDADSEGIEGKYYVWKYDELLKVLGDDLMTFNLKYDVTKDGNFEGSNILVQKENVNLNKNDEIKISKLENKLLTERKKRIKPFFDNKIQTDLNCYWLYSNLYSSLILEDKELLDQTNKKIEFLKAKLSKKIFHCYDKNEDEIDVFLEDYAYFGLLLISDYEINNNEKSLSKCMEIMEIAWKLFFNEEYNLLQKNKIKDNDLFTNPVDITDNNIPNGNSIYFYVINKLYDITENASLKEKLIKLSQSFHAFINTNFSQMFSYYKSLNIYEEKITITIHGNFEKKNDLLFRVIKNCFGKGSIIYKKNVEEFFVIICKNQTCSEKLKDFTEIKNHLNNL